MLLTTGSVFEGYHIKEYLGVVSKEVVYKNGLSKSFSAAVSDLFDSFSLKDCEMTGSTELISSAKEYIFAQFIKEAEAKGANAILGIDFETSFGDNLFRLAVNGTAVLIEKNMLNVPKSAVPFIIPVASSTQVDSFCPISTTVVPDEQKSAIALTIFQPGSLAVSAVEASLTFRNIFHDEFLVENACFINFQLCDGHRYTSGIYHAHLPENILICPKEISVEIKKYIVDGQIFPACGTDTISPEEFLRTHAPSFDADLFMTALAEFKNARSMLDYLHDSDLDPSSKLFFAISQVLNKRSQIERLYGGSVENTLKEIRQVIDEYLSP